MTNGAFAGSGLGVNFSDRPVINVQAGRGTSIGDLAIQGPLTAWVISNDLGVAARTSVSGWWVGGGGDVVVVVVVVGDVAAGESSSSSSVAAATWRRR